MDMNTKGSNQGDALSDRDDRADVIEAARLVRTWLESDEQLRIPDTELGGELYDAIRLLVNRGSAL